MRQLPGTEVKMVLCDANYQNADTLLLVSDKYGRVAGKFTLPESGLLGNYVVK